MPDCVTENDEVKPLGDMNIQSDHVIEARRLDIVEKKCAIIDIAVAGDKRMGQRRMRRLECVRNLKKEIVRMWDTRTVQVIPINVESLGSLTKGGHKNKYFTNPKNYASRNSKNFKESIKVLE